MSDFQGSIAGLLCLLKVDYKGSPRPSYFYIVNETFSNNKNQNKMKTKILVLGVSIAITLFLNRAIAQQTPGDSPSVEKISYATVLTIPWYYPPLYETGGSAVNIDEPAVNLLKSGHNSSDTSLSPEGLKNFSESNQNGKYNDPVEFGIDEYVTIAPKRF
jgi:hypothetical protein